MKGPEAGIESVIELNDFIRVKRLATTGGKAKMLIRSGRVLVNTQVETRNRKKLYRGDVVVVEGKKYVVDDSLMKS